LFECVALRLPELDAHLWASLKLEGQAVDSRELARFLSRTTELAGALERELTSLAAAVRSVHTDLAAASDELEAMVTRLKELDSLAFRLRLAGLNAHASATRAGECAFAFAAVTRQLGSLTDATRDASTRLKAIIGDMDMAARSFVHLQESLRGVLETLAHDASRGLGGVVTELRAALDEVQRVFADCAARGHSAADGVKAVMLEIQRQDIHRQGLEHVGIVLHELAADLSKPGHTDREGYAFRERAAIVGRDVLARVDEEVLQLVERTGALLGSLEDVLALLRAGRRTLEDGLVTRLPQPSVALTLTAAKASEAVRELCECNLIVGQLSGSLSAVPDGLRGLEDVVRELRVVHVLIKMELARSEALQRISTTALQVGEAQQQYTELLQDLWTLLGRVGTKLDSLNRVLGGVPERSEALARLSGQLTAHERELSAWAGAARGELARVDEREIPLLKTLTAFRRDLAQFTRDDSAPARVQQLFERVAAEARESLRQTAHAGGVAGQGGHDDALPPANTTSRLGAVISRFTVLEHKQIGSSVAAIEVESGDSGGAFTLF
jgi:hypothetical protein